MVTGAEDGTARLLDLTTFRPIGTPIELGAAHVSVGAHPDGDHVLVGREGADTPALLWNVDPDAWEARACELAGRNVFAQEWEALMPGTHRADLRVVTGRIRRTRRGDERVRVYVVDLPGDPAHTLAI